MLLGKGDYYPGLIPLVYAYLDEIKCDPGVKNKVHKYLELIERRATGNVPQGAGRSPLRLSGRPREERARVKGPCPLGTCFILLAAHVERRNCEVGGAY